MRIQPGLNRIGTFDLETTRRQAQDAGYTIFALPGNGIFDRASFFEAARATFPLDPPLIGSHSWDALSDSLWEGLYRHSAQRIVILWPKTQSMASSAPVDFEIALNMLADVASLLADARATCDKPKEIAILVE